MGMNTLFLRFTSLYYEKRGSRDVDEIDSMSTALALIQNTLFSSAKGNKNSDKIDETEPLKESVEKTVSFGNPNLSDSQVTHSIIYLGWLVFFSFASIFGALAPLSMQMNRELEEESLAHNHIPGGTFQI